MDEGIVGRQARRILEERTGTEDPLARFESGI
jgi:hypothetical protein